MEGLWRRGRAAGAGGRPAAWAGDQTGGHPAAWATELPLVDLDRTTGAMTPASEHELERRVAAAAAAKDFRTATQLQCMLDALGPRRDLPPPAGLAPDANPLAPYCATDPDTAAELFLTNGFVVLPAVVPPPQLAAMQAAYAGAAPAARAEFDARWAAGTERVDVGQSYGFPMFGGGASPDAALPFVPLLAPPLLVQTLHRVLGGPPGVNDAREAAGVVVPPADPAVAHSAEGYLSWHRDYATGRPTDGWPYPTTRYVKVSTYLYDVPQDGAPLTLVPLSHRLPNAPQQTLSNSFRGGRGHYHKPQSPTRPTHLPPGYRPDGLPAWIGGAADLPSVAMPNCMRCAVPAGRAGERASIRD
eukprot:SAG22_NODE_138_length_18031_cov_5.796621_12_plen_359_part_00